MRWSFHSVKNRRVGVSTQRRSGNRDDIVQNRKSEQQEVKA